MTSHDRGQLPEPLTPTSAEPASTSPTSAPTPTPAWAPAQTEPLAWTPRPRPGRDTDPDPHRCRAVEASSGGRFATWRDLGRGRRDPSAVLAAGGTAALVRGPFAPAAAGASADPGALTVAAGRDRRPERPPS